LLLLELLVYHAAMAELLGPEPFGQGIVLTVSAAPRIAEFARISWAISDRVQCFDWPMDWPPG
jgi:hypothetical protein